MENLFVILLITIFGSIISIIKYNIIMKDSDYKVHKIKAKCHFCKKEYIANFVSTRDEVTEIDIKNAYCSAECYKNAVDKIKDSVHKKYESLRKGRIL